MKNLEVTIAQINTVSGDIIGNANKIIKTIQTNPKSDIIVFPETAISGYCVGALWDNVNFVIEQGENVKKLLKYIPENQTVIVGFVRFLGMKKNGLPRLKNSVAILSGGKMETYDKQLLANSDHHEDKKYFEPGDESKVFEISTKHGTLKIGVPICEDAWFNSHNRNIPKEMCKMGAEILIVPNQSYFYYNKQKLRKELFSTIAKENNVPVITVNSCGVGDIVKNIMIFDGGSMIFDERGRLLREFPQFEEWIKSHTFSQAYTPVFEERKDKYGDVLDALIFEQKELFNLLGLKKAQVHISGGIDSAIVGYIVTKSMGKENVVFITNPTNLNSKSLKFVEELSKKLDVPIITNPLQEIYDKFISVDTDTFGSELYDTGKATVQAVLRTVQGLAASHRFKTGIVATGNHTEIVLGWASFHDIGSIGVHAPIGDLTKIELYELSAYINKRENKEIIPADLFNGKIKPAAELPDSMEDPIDYWIQSGICAEMIRNHKSSQELISEFNNKTLTKDFFPNLPNGKSIYDNYSLDDFKREVKFAFDKSRISVFKAAQGAPIVILTPRSRGFSNRETIINKYIS